MENKLHFVLIHGAWHGSWAWKNVSSKLSEKNFKVSCPNLTGLGERKHLISNQITIDTFIKDVENHIIYQNLENGKIDLLIGTHALFQKKIKFKSNAWYSNGINARI